MKNALHRGRFLFVKNLKKVLDIKCVAIYNKCVAKKKGDDNHWHQHTAGHHLKTQRNTKSG